MTISAPQQRLLYTPKFSLVSDFTTKHFSIGAIPKAETASKNYRDVELVFRLFLGTKKTDRKGVDDDQYHSPRRALGGNRSCGRRFHRPGSRPNQAVRASQSGRHRRRGEGARL